MAICKYCELEMNGADGCVKLPVKTIDGEMDPIPYGSERRDEPPAPGQRHHGVLIGDPPRCHDCDVLPGHYHHVGCDWEECPRCHGQLIGCDCEPESDDATDEHGHENIELLCHDCRFEPAHEHQSSSDIETVAADETGRMEQAKDQEKV